MSQLKWIAAVKQMEALKGRVAVVTGGSEGIGGDIVRRLAEEGMKVAALARRRYKLMVSGNQEIKNSRRSLVRCSQGKRKSFLSGMLKVKFFFPRSTTKPTWLDRIQTGAAKFKNVETSNA